jgi:hypothetical protein
MSTKSKSLYDQFLDAAAEVKKSIQAPFVARRDKQRFQFALIEAEQELSTLQIRKTEILEKIGVNELNIQDLVQNRVNMENQRKTIDAIKAVHLELFNKELKSED